MLLKYHIAWAYTLILSRIKCIHHSELLFPSTVLPSPQKAACVHKVGETHFGGSWFCTPVLSPPHKRHWLNLFASLSLNFLISNGDNKICLNKIWRKMVTLLDMLCVCNKYDFHCPFPKSSCAGVSTRTHASTSADSMGAGCPSHLATPESMAMVQQCVVNALMVTVLGCQ